MNQFETEGPTLTELAVVVALLLAVGLLVWVKAC